MVTALTSHLRQMHSGWNATKLILSLRWRLVRSRKTRILIYISGLFVSIGVLSSMNLGYAIELSIREQNPSQNLKLQTMIGYLLHGTENNIGALLLISIFAMAFFAPFTGSTTVSLFPSEDLQSIRPSETHRFFDALIVNCISGIGLLQILTLMGITSILTIDVNRFIPIIMAWALWICLVSLMTTIGWTLEYFIRRFGKLKRRIIGLIVAAIFAGGFLFEVSIGISPFIVGDLYIKKIRYMGTTGWGHEAILYLLGFSLTFIFLLIVGSAITKKAMLLSAPPTAIGLGHRKAKMTTNNTKLSLRLLFQTIWRTTECRKPILAIILFGAPAMLFSSTKANTGIILTLAVPLTVALAWGVNAFGILGTGMNWLAAQPKIMKKLPFFSMLTQTIVSFLLIMILWVIALASGRSVLSDGISVLVMGFFSVFGASVFGAYLSMHHPIRTQLTSRGNALVPPLTALSYLLQLIIITGIPSVVFYLNLSLYEQFMAFTTLLGIYLIGFYTLTKKWEDAETQARVVQIVSAT